MFRVNAVSSGVQNIALIGHSNRLPAPRQAVSWIRISNASKVSGYKNNECTTTQPKTPSNTGPKKPLHVDGSSAPHRLAPKQPLHHIQRLTEVRKEEAKSWISLECAHDHGGRERSITARTPNRSMPT
jgi:hypothetical protein